MTVEPSGQSERAEFKPISGADVDLFLIWCKGRDFGESPQIANADALDAFRGFSIGDLKWLCQAMIQAKAIPDLSTMARAILARDVAILRSNDRNP